MEAQSSTKPIHNGAVVIQYRVPDQARQVSMAVPSVQSDSSFRVTNVSCDDHTADLSIRCNMASIESDDEDASMTTYIVTKHVLRSKRGALVDRGANGGILGDDARTLLIHERVVDVTGIDNHEMNSLKIVDASAKVMTQRGPVVLILRQYAWHGQGRTIHSAIQLEYYKNRVDDRSILAGGTQCIKTADGYIIPLDIINGLPYMKMSPNTDKEWDELPHVILTSGDSWKTTVLDSTVSNKDEWYTEAAEAHDDDDSSPFDEFGNYLNREPCPKRREGNEVDPPVDPTPYETTPDEDHQAQQRINAEHDREELLLDSDYQGNDHTREIFLHASNLNERYVCYEHDASDPVEETAEKLEVVPKETKAKRFDYNKFRPYFLHIPLDKMRKTFENTTQFATKIISGRVIQKTLKSPFPAHNVRRRNEPVATDTIYAATPAIASGGMQAAQIFIGRVSLVIDIYGMKSTAEFVNTLEDVIRKRGAMDKLVSDGASVEISQRVLDILRALCIDNWMSERDFQHQNFAEHRWHHFKRNIQWIMNWRNVPPEIWLLCAEWVADVMNHTAERSLGWRPPLQVLSGQTVDISIMLVFMFWDVVYVARYKDNHYNAQIGHQKSDEIRGRFVGFAWDVGHHLTFKILTDDTRKIIHRSRVRLGEVAENNMKLDVEAGAKPDHVHVRSKRDGDGTNARLPTIDMSGAPFPPTRRVTRSMTQPPVSAPNAPPLVTDTPPGEPPTTPGESKTTDPTLGENEQPFPPSALHDDVGHGRTLPVVETVTEEDDDEGSVDYESVAGEDEQYCAMKDPPIANRNAKDSNQIDESKLPSHLLQDPPDDPYPFTTKEEVEAPNVPDLPDIAEATKDKPPGLPPEEMIERSFLLPANDDGTRFRATVIRATNAHRKSVQNDPKLTKFRCLINDEYEDVLAYNQLLDFIEDDQAWDGLWKFRRILRHESGITRKHKNYKGGSTNLLMEWETGECTWEPCRTNEKTGIFDQDPITVATYVKENKLEDEECFKFPGLLTHIKNIKKLTRRVNQAKLHSFRTKPVYMYGFLVPRNHEQAMSIDERNGNTKWQDSEKLELSQIDSYDTFEDKGVGHDPGIGWKKIRVHMVYAVKHDGRHKSRLVAGGHLTETPIDSVYSSVVSLRGIRILTFLSELNNMETWATDIGNAYLESYTKEMVYIRAGPEFREREGHILIIRKALYGLRSSGLRWRERFSDVLMSMGFVASFSEPDIWMRDKSDHWEYIAVYVDDLLIVSRDPKTIIASLEGEHNFKLKGSGPISFHLGCDFQRDPDGVLCYQPKKYVEKILGNYKMMFGSNPRQVTSPLTKGDHPELCDSELLDEEDTKKYQSLVGSLQWVIQIGRFDVTTAVMTLSRFRAAPRKGHLERVQRIFGYLSKMRHGVIRIRTEEPDYSDIPEKLYEWDYTAYAGAKETIPHNCPRALGKRVITSTFVDANLYHDMISGRSVTGVLHLFNKTPVDWFSKLQSTVETATFGSEYVAARTATEQIIDLRNTLRYLGAPVEGPTYLFGDNETVVNTASVPYSKLHKRHNALSYHRVREAIAAGIIRFHHIRGKLNPADVLSKHWDYPSVWQVLRPLMFWQGDTAELMQPLSATEETEKTTTRDNEKQ